MNSSTLSGLALAFGPEISIEHEATPASERVTLRDIVLFLEENLFLGERGQRLEQLRARMRHLYLAEKKPIPQVARELSVSEFKTTQWMKKWRIPIRHYVPFLQAAWWERLCFEIAEALYGKITTHPRLENGCIPDWMVKANGKTLLFDAKLSAGFTAVEKAIQHYAPHCDHLEFWILHHSRAQASQRVSFVSADELAKITSAAGRPDLSAKITATKHGYNPFLQTALEMFNQPTPQKQAPEEELLDLRALM